MSRLTDQLASRNFQLPLTHPPSIKMSNQQPSQEALLAALAAQSSRAPPPTKSFAELAAPADLTNGVATDSGADALVNSRKIYCTRQGCGAVILQPGVGEWVEAEPGIVSSVVGREDARASSLTPAYSSPPRRAPPSPPSRPPSDTGMSAARPSPSTTLASRAPMRAPPCPTTRLALLRPRAKSSGSSVPSATLAPWAGALRVARRRGWPSTGCGTPPSRRPREQLVGQ